MRISNNRCLQAALIYAARGWPVFPVLERGKTPATHRGFHDASVQPGRIRQWWNSTHNYNIGIATGSLSGLWVLDVDGDRGAFFLNCLEVKHGRLPSTMTCITASGCHLYFRVPEIRAPELTGSIPCSTARVGDDLDVRGDGGYIIVPPSIHPNGTVYRWSGPHDPAAPPAWLVKRALPRPQKVVPDEHRIGSPNATGYGKTVLEHEAAELAATGAGSRNDTLNRVAFRLFHLVAQGCLNAGEVHNRLIDCCVVNGLLADDGLHSVHKTIASASKAGIQSARR